MPENSRKHSLSRRSFLKGTTAIAGVAAIGGTLAGCGSPKASGVAEDAVFEPGQIAAEGEQIFRGVCHPNCFGFCHVNVHVRDGKIVKTSRAPYKDGTYSRICQRGLSHVQRIYDPERLQYPLRRVEGTERGAGEWERISWDEAISDIAEHMKQVQGTYGPKAIAKYGGSNVTFGTTFQWSRFIQAFDITSIGTAADAASMYGGTLVAGTSTWENSERTDLVNAKTIVAWGDNLTVAQHHMWHLVKEARDAGAKLVVIDPTFTQLASKSDWWIPIRPGTDTALLLALCNRVFKDDRIDEEYLRSATVAPFLVRSDTGRFLRMSEVDPAVAAAKAAQEKAAGEAAAAVMAQYADQGEIVAGMAAQAVMQQMAFDDQPAVLQGGRPIAANEAGAPELFATYTYEGVNCQTALSLLRENVRANSFEWASELTEIPVEDIERLYDVVVDTPVSHMVGYGPQAYSNGKHTYHAGYTLCGLLGNLGKPGASWGSEWMFCPAFNTTYFIEAGMSVAPEINVLAFPEVIESGTWQGNPYPIKMLFVHGGNPINCSPDTNVWLNTVVPGLDYIVTVDSVLTDTARYSDLVLPVAQWFEQSDVTQGGEVPTVSYSEKAIEPLYESKTDAEIMHLIAEQFGLGDFFTTDTDVINAAILDCDELKALDVTFEKVKAEGEARFVPDNPHIAFRDGVFNTPTGRLEFYVEDPQPRCQTPKEITPELIEREHLANWFPPAEAWHENEAMQKYPLVCNSERPRFRVHSQWFGTPLLRELDPEPIVKMNSVDADARGLESGDYVECFNDHGHVVAKLVVSEAVRPGVVVYPKGWQRHQHKAGSWSELISTDYDPFSVNSNFMDVVCEVRAWEGE